MREGSGIGRIRDLLNLSPQNLRKVPHVEFKLAWYAIASLLTHLHPDSAHEHGKETATDFVCANPDLVTTPALCNPYYLRSGWPVALENIAEEARKRYQGGLLSEHEYYCGGAPSLEILQKHTCYITEETVARRKTAS